MTHCSRCGLVSEDDQLCSWCGATFATRAPQVLIPQEPPARKRQIGLVGIAAAVILAVGILLLFRYLRSSEAEVADAATIPDSHRQSSSQRPGPALGSHLPRPSAAQISAAPRLRADSSSAPAVAEGSVDPAVQGSGSGSRIAPTASASPASGAGVAQGAAHLADARLALGQDAEGQEMAGGRVVIVNDGPYEITDFRISLQIAGTSYELMPFSGSPDSPVPLVSRSIKAGDRVEIPVMTTAPYRNDNLDIAYRVVLRASLDGPPGTVTDSISVPGG